MGLLGNLSTAQIVEQVRAATLPAHTMLLAPPSPPAAGWLFLAQPPWARSLAAGP
jgi:hypothetical protein